MGEEGTGRRLLKAFSELTQSKSYWRITIQEIASKAGVAPSTFYLYYKSKEELLREYMSEVLGYVRGRLEELLDERPLIGLRKMIWELISVHEDPTAKPFYKSLRELEFISPELALQFYSQLTASISEFIERWRGSVFRNDVDPEIVADAIIGGVMFIHMARSSYKPGCLDVDAEVLGDIILKGISGCKPLPEPPSFTELREVKADELIDSLGILERLGFSPARSKFVKAALRAFSRKSYYETKIYEISEEAGYAVGMFYKVYSTKKDVLRDLVDVLGKVIRRYISMEAERYEDRRLKEVAGSRAFLNFVEWNSELYRIVRESEFVDPAIPARYYTPFIEGYAEGLREGMRRCEIAPHPPYSLAISLMGINHMLGQAYIYFKRLHSISYIVSKLWSLLTSGILEEWGGIHE
ncbi:MAG: hypothetical protein DRN96_03050 [Thermoproteota archaeon]|nr:MAG: hypothetical protein DRN96_03050 [Candidatus Korarchaeota archaeon]